MTESKHPTEVVEAESIKLIDKTQTGTVPAGGNTMVDITPPLGYLYELMAIQIYIPSPSDATSGTHRVSLMCAGGDVGFLTGESTYNVDLLYSGGEWSKADVEQVPTDPVAQVLRPKGVRVDNNTPFQIGYINSTDVDQTQDRTYAFFVRKIKVG